MMSFAGPHLALSSTTSKPIRISHCRTPSLSSTSSTAVSSTEDELLTDSTTLGSSPLDRGGSKCLPETNPESDIDVDLSMGEPKTPMPLMTPTTPTDRFTRLSVSSRLAKGDAFVHRRYKSIHAHRREGGMAGERTPRSAGLLGFQHRGREEVERVEVEGAKAVKDVESTHTANTGEKRIDRNVFQSQPRITHEATPIRKVELSLTARRNTNKSSPGPRHQPYRSRQSGPRHTEGNHTQPVLAVESLPPALKGKLQGETTLQWLLVGPDVARHLHMGGSVLVRDYAGNVVGWMA